MGTLVTISADEYRAFAKGLALLAPTRALWKLSDADLPGTMAVADLDLAENVRALAWVPQNDLLGDGRLAAFVTHGGINSIYEAAYHGVPVAGIPIFGDQPDNVAKAVSFFGVFFSVLPSEGPFPPPPLRAGKKLTLTFLPPLLPPSPFGKIPN